LACNVDGSLGQRTDQRGTVLGYAYTSNRLLAGQSATTLGSGVDGAVRSIALGYDNLSRQQNITSYASTGGTGTVVSDVQFAYNDFGQVATTYQSHGGAVNTSTSPNVQSTYDTATTGSVFSAQHRRQTIVYPNGRTVYLDYGTSGAAYDALSKVRTIRDTGSTGTALATYGRTGTPMIARSRTRCRGVPYGRINDGCPGFAHIQRCSTGTTHSPQFPAKSWMAPSCRRPPAPLQPLPHRARPGTMLGGPP
jgi:hypothetical protein